MAARAIRSVRSRALSPRALLAASTSEGGNMKAVYRNTGGGLKLTTMYPDPVVSDRPDIRYVPAITNQKVLPKGKTRTPYAAVPITTNLGRPLTYTTTVDTPPPPESGLTYNTGTRQVESSSPTKKEGTYKFKLKVTDDADTPADEVFEFETTVTAAVDPIDPGVPEDATVIVESDFAAASGLKFDAGSGKVVDRDDVKQKTSGTYPCTIKIQTSKEEETAVTVATTVHTPQREGEAATFDPSSRVIPVSATVTVEKDFPPETGLTFDITTKQIQEVSGVTKAPGNYSCDLQLKETKATTVTKTLQAEVKATFTPRQVTAQDLKTVKNFKLSEKVPLDPASGLYVDLANFEIKEKPGAEKTPGTYVFQLQLKGRDNRVYSKWLEVTIDPDPKILPEGDLPKPVIGQPLQQMVPKPGSTTGEQEPADIVFQLVGAVPGGTPPVIKDPSALPRGLSYCCGKLAGVPEEVGTFEFTVEALDGDGKPVTRQCKMVIDAPKPLEITTKPPLAIGRVGETYSQSFETKDGSGVIRTWTITPLPEKLHVTKAGLLTGTPVKPGAYQVTVTANDTAGGSDSKPYTLDIQPAPFRIKNPAKLPDGKVGAGYAQSLGAEGGYEAYQAFAIVDDPMLPPGVKLSGDTLQGEPATPGTYRFSATVKDQKNTVATKEFEITIAALPLTVDSDGPIPEGEIAQTFSARFVDQLAGSQAAIH